MFRITSSAFGENHPIPSMYTADGANISPPLQWFDVPRETKTFALIVDDPDAPDPRAPERTWVHWVLYNIPAGSKMLRADAMKHGLPTGARQGLNDWKQDGYGGPAPPVGRHRYVHRLYALDTVLPELGRPTKARLLEAIRGHVLAQAQLIGTYQAGP